MSSTLTYILVGLVLLDVVITSLIFFANQQRTENRLTPLTSIAVAPILGGLLIGGTRIGYALAGVGALLACADLFILARRA